MCVCVLTSLERSSLQYHNDVFWFEADSDPRFWHKHSATMTIACMTTSMLNCGTSQVSPDDRLLAYTVDTHGDERCELRVVDIGSGSSLLPEPIHGCSGDAVWGADSRTLYFVAKVRQANGV